MGELTVRETLDFAARCQGVGHKAGAARGRRGTPKRKNASLREMLLHSTAEWQWVKASAGLQPKRMQHLPFCGCHRYASCSWFSTTSAGSLLQVRVLGKMTRIICIQPRSNICASNHAAQSLLRLETSCTCADNLQKLRELEKKIGIVLDPTQTYLSTSTEHALQA